MAYAALTDVEALLPNDQELDDLTPPLRASVTDWLDQIDGTINVALAEGSKTSPATDPDMLTKLQLLEAKEAAYMVMQVRGISADDKVLWTGYHDEYLAQLEILRTPPEEGASSGDAESGEPWSWQMEHVTDQTVEPVFFRGKKY